jgi:hypothetical protein
MGKDTTKVCVAPQVEKLDARAQTIMVPTPAAGWGTGRDARRQNLKYGKIGNAVGA